jgi:hypothetical protein
VHTESPERIMTKAKKGSVTVLLFFSLSVLTLAGADTLKKQFESLYPTSYLNEQPKKAYLVCLSDKFAATVPSLATAFDHVSIMIANGTILKMQGPIHSYFHKGELLFLGYRKIEKDSIRMIVYSVNPHSITAGTGAFQHQNTEVVAADVHFMFPQSVLKGNDIAPIKSEIEKFFKCFPDYDSAIAFGNTASGVFVPEIKIGMTLAEVEKTLGPPDMKFSFPDKILYKYKDFTIEFKNNIVTNIIF